MDGNPTRVNRRAILCGTVAAGVLCLGWFLPPAHPDTDADTGSTVVPAEQADLDGISDQAGDLSGVAGDPDTGTAAAG
ncbi:hypothetical protein [Streptomyces sp. RFCAC02]|uniref:hypothetical protein n=1 Tax=Streptomyces sp. RFCAC02 TaxID=2499143 RepID=UPI00143DB79B|nr:hypothetical protein [Streptomyces sp. RFCAC02]